MKNLLCLLAALCLLSCNKDDDSDPTPNVPTSIKVLSITINDFPTTDTGGASWDTFDGADIYPAIYFGNTLLFDLRNEAITNATSGPITWQVNGEVLANPTGTYSINLYDKDDLSEDDWIGGIQFHPWSAGNGNPTTLTVSCSGCATSWTLTIDYEF